MYALWANTTKAERQVALQSALEEHVNTSLAACRITPLASKELYEIVLQAILQQATMRWMTSRRAYNPSHVGFNPPNRTAT